MTAGFAAWVRVDPARSHHSQRPVRPDARHQEWTLFSLRLEALVGQFAALHDVLGASVLQG